MKNKILYHLSAVFSILCIVLFSGCAGNPGNGQTNHTNQSTTTIIQQTIIKVSQNTSLGDILTDGKGMTLYVFKNDEPDKSNCYDQCATIWHPIISKGEVSAPGDVSTYLGTTTRIDGSIQVTYKGMPLYQYSPDQKPGDIKGEGINGVWFAAGITNMTATTLATATTQQPTTQIATTTTNAGTVTTVPASMNSVVEISGLAFNPSVIRIGKGGMVTWKNLDAVSHTITSDSGGELSSDSLTRGSTYSHTFNNPGVYAYHCSFIPGMKGTVIVGDVQASLTTTTIQKATTTTIQVIQPYTY